MSDWPLFTVTGISSRMMKKALSIIIILDLIAGTAMAGVDIVRSNGISLTGADGIRYVGTSGISLTGADGYLAYRSNGITLTGADGITLTGADTSTVGPDGASYTGPNGITLTGADGMGLVRANGITLTGADGITLTGADGTQYRADSVLIRQPNGITLTGADGITLTGADGITLTGADGMSQVAPNGITLTGADAINAVRADGITLTGADGITLTGADGITGFGPTGVVFQNINPAGITLTGADGITLTGADGITLTGADGILMRNVDGITLTGADGQSGLQSIDPELAVVLNNSTDDSSINAVVVFYGQVTDVDIDQLRQLGITGGTRFKVLPMVYISATRPQIIALSRLARVRSIYGNRTLNFNSDPYFKPTGVSRVSTDRDLSTKNGGLPVSGRNVTVAVLDTGVNGLHPDLSGKVVQNVRLADTQSVPAGFLNPVPVENVTNSDPVAGHGTFVAGIIAGSGSSSGGKYGGVAPGARILGLSAGDVNLMSVLSGYDYLLDKGASYNVRVVNCSFSANTVYDSNDPVNIATKMLTDRGVNVVFSAGNSGPGNGTVNPYASAPWVIAVGATDENGTLAAFSSRGTFGSDGSPTLVAPGVNIASLRSTVSTTSVGGLAGADTQRLTAGEMPYYTTASGTSFSAPQVAGAVALMLEENPTLSPAAVKDILGRTATPLPRYFYHEAGAGMLNTYAAVLESAFPDRRMGMFRSTLSANAVRFTTSTPQSFSQMVVPGTPSLTGIPMPANVVQATVGIAWAMSTNDFGLKVFDSGNNLAGQSNYLNSPGLTGRTEKVVLRNPSVETFTASVEQTGGIGTSQNVYGALQVTQVAYPVLSDVSSLSPDSLTEAQKSILANVVLPLGKKFRPDSQVSRFEFASALLRAGAAPQYMAASPLFTDVRDQFMRGPVESVQTNPNGKLFYDASAGGQFYPDALTSRLVAAVAFVKAANLDSSAATAVLPATVADGLTIPSSLRGYVSVALQRGFLTLDGNNQFNGNRALTRLELSRGTNALFR